MDTLRVLICDDHTMFRDGVRALLSSAPDLEYAGEASNGVEAVSMASKLQPDVILMDVNMPDLDGIEATRRILAASPGIRVLVLTMFQDDSSVFASMRAGARGYVLKGAKHDEMLRAIRAVGNGEAIFSPAIALRMIDFFASAHPVTPLQPFAELSEREHEILELIARGHKNNEIANRLVLSEKTVRNHVSNIMSKLQVTDRTQAILRAREAGLG